MPSRFAVLGLISSNMLTTLNTKNQKVYPNMSNAKMQRYFIFYFKTLPIFHCKQYIPRASNAYSSSVGDIAFFIISLITVCSALCQVMRAQQWEQLSFSLYTKPFWRLHDETFIIYFKSTTSVPLFHQIQLYIFAGTACCLLSQYLCSFKIQSGCVLMCTILTD